MKIGIRVPPCEPANKVAAFVARAEALGFDMAWVPDSQLLWRDAYLALALAATRTSTIGLGSAVTNLTTRHPSVVASLVRTLQELAPDRIVLGLGAGSSSVRPLGLPLATGAELADGMDQIRLLLAGGEATFDGHGVTMRDVAAPSPIFLAVTGPKRLELAGRLADGAILHRGTTPDLLAPAIALLGEGARSAERRLDGFEIVVTGIGLLTDDVVRDARLVKPICRTMFQDGGGDALRSAGIEVRDGGRSPAQPGRASAATDFKHGVDWERAVSDADAAVSDESALCFAEQFCFMGDERQLAQRFAQLEAIGVTQVLLQDLSSHQLPEALLEGIAPLAGRGTDRAEARR